MSAIPIGTFTAANGNTYYVFPFEERGAELRRDQGGVGYVLGYIPDVEADTPELLVGHGHHVDEAARADYVERARRVVRDARKRV